MIKRNSVVTHEKVGSGFWSPYGRVITIRNQQALVVNCLRELEWFPLVELEEHDYDGKWDKKYLPEYWETGLSDQENEKYVYYVWRAFPTLRKLKQMASIYHPEIWKKRK